MPGSEGGATVSGRTQLIPPPSAYFKFTHRLPLLSFSFPLFFPLSKPQTHSNPHILSISPIGDEQSNSSEVYPSQFPNNRITGHSLFGREFLPLERRDKQISQEGERTIRKKKKKRESTNRRKEKSSSHHLFLITVDTCKCINPMKTAAKMNLKEENNEK